MTHPYPWHVDHLPKRRIKTADELSDGLEIYEIGNRLYPPAWRALLRNLERASAMEARP